MMNKSSRLTSKQAALSVLTGASLFCSVVGSALSQESAPTYPIRQPTGLCNLLDSVSDTDLAQRFGQILQPQQASLVGKLWDYQIESTQLSDHEKGMIKEFTQLLAQRGIDLTVAPVPPRGVVFPALSVTGITDAESSLTAKAYESYSENLSLFGDVVSIDSTFPLEGFFKTSSDWTPLGAHWFAQQLAERITPAYTAQLLAPQGNVIRAGGALRSYVEQVCATTLPAEFVPSYALQAAKDNAATIAIIGDRMATQTKFQFADLLAHYTGQQTVNFAASASSDYWGWPRLIDALTRQGSTFSNLVWQLTARQQVPVRRLLAQISPVLRQNCNSNEALLKHTQGLDLTAPSNEVVIALAAHNKGYRDLTLSLGFDAANIEGVALTVWFDNGKKQNFTLDYAFTGPYQSQFYLDLQAFEVERNRLPIVLEIREIKWSQDISAPKTVDAHLGVCPISGS